MLVTTVEGGRASSLVRTFAVRKQIVLVHRLKNWMETSKFGNQWTILWGDDMHW